MEFTFDFATLGLGGVSLALVVFGLTEFIKTLTGLSGKWVNVLAVVLGAAFVVLQQVTPTLPEVYQFWVDVGVKAIAGGLTAGGWYLFSTKQFDKLKPVEDGSPEAIG